MFTDAYIQLFEDTIRQEREEFLASPKKDDDASNSRIALSSDANQQPNARKSGSRTSGSAPKQRKE